MVNNMNETNNVSFFTNKEVPDYLKSFVAAAFSGGMCHKGKCEEGSTKPTITCLIGSKFMCTTFGADFANSAEKIQGNNEMLGLTEAMGGDISEKEVLAKLSDNLLNNYPMQHVTISDYNSKFISHSISEINAALTEANMSQFVQAVKEIYEQYQEVLLQKAAPADDKKKQVTTPADPMVKKTLVEA